MAKKKILTLVTNAKTLTLTDGTAHPSGYWAEELALPLELFEAAGRPVDIATLGGIVPTVDASSLDPGMMKWTRPAHAEVDDAAQARRFERTLAACVALRSPTKLDDIGKDALAAYAGIYVAGGHGCMEDMPASPVLTRILLHALALDLPIAAVCHGPTAFLAPRDAAGQSPFAGYRMTCFSHVEEFQTPINGRLPLVLEIELGRLGIHYSKAPYPWGSHVVVDRNVVTGQNPHSSEALASEFLRLLDRV